VSAELGSESVQLADSCSLVVVLRWQPWDALLAICIII
jgi:hypothetical protein